MQSITGRIVEILAESGGKCAVIVLYIFKVCSTQHEIFMPMLAQCHHEEIYAIISSTVCIFSSWSHI